MSKKQTDNRFWRIKKGEPIPEWLQKGATVAGMVAGDDLIVIPSETEGYDVYLANPNSSRPMMKVTAENMPEGFSITGAPTCFRTTSSLHYTIGKLQKENKALADALRGLLQAYEKAFDWSAELPPETAEAERIANKVLHALTSSKPEQSGWQPIETAPKDGTQFQAWIEKYGWEPHARFNPDSEAFELWGPVDYDEDGWGVYPHMVPTHWMPLPTPPTAGGDDE